MIQRRAQAAGIRTRIGNHTVVEPMAVIGEGCEVADRVQVRAALDRVGLLPRLRQRGQAVMDPLRRYWTLHDSGWTHRLMKPTV